MILLTTCHVICFVVEFQCFIAGFYDIFNPDRLFSPLIESGHDVRNVLFGFILLPL